MVIEARQSFRFSDKIPGFLEIIEVWLSLGISMHNLISTTKL